MPGFSVEYFEKVVGLEPVRVEEFRAGKVGFPCVRLGPESLLDLMPEKMAAPLNAMGAKLSPLVATSAGNRVHHVCLAMSRAEFEALRGRIEAHGGKTVPMQQQFGAVLAGARPDAGQQPGARLLHLVWEPE